MTSTTTGSIKGIKGAKARIVDVAFGIEPDKKAILFLVAWKNRAIFAALGKRWPDHREEVVSYSLRAGVGRVDESLSVRSVSFRPGEPGCSGGYIAIAVFEGSQWSSTAMEWTRFCPRCGAGRYLGGAGCAGCSSCGKRDPGEVAAYIVEGAGLVTCGMRFSWEFPAGLADVTAHGEVLRMHVDEDGHLTCAELRVDPNDRLRELRERVSAQLEEAREWHRKKARETDDDTVRPPHEEFLRPSSARAADGLDGGGGTTCFPGEGVERALRAGRLKVWFREAEKRVSSAGEEVP